jgi:Ran GTPase-activating protein (RanGAP) involved in mRNA processing and transport
MRDKIRVKITGSIATQVDLEGMAITDDEIEEIAQEIKTLKPGLQLIDLSNNKIGDSGAKIISQIFAELHDLSEIRLEGNNIGKDGATALFLLKKTHPSITIDLSGNRIFDAKEAEDLEHAPTTRPQNNR